MKLINTDGLALIGPGSEWFWTAISGLVLAVTFLAIYRQLRMQRSAAAIEQVERIGNEWGSERMARSMLAILVAHQAGTDRAAIPEGAAAEIGDFWQRVGYLTRSGHVDRRLVHQFSGQVQRWWARLRPYALAQRELRGARVWTEFDWLADMMARLDAKAGVTIRTDDEDLARHLPKAIAELRELIETEEALRTVPVRLVTTPVTVMAVRPHGGDGSTPVALGEAPPAVA